jgi:hypothetical protein
LESPEDVETLRLEALKEAQVDHWRELREAAIALRDRVVLSDHPRLIPTGWEEALKETRDPKYLMQALTEVHAPDHHLWSALDIWGKHVKALREAYQEAEWWFSDCFASWEWESPGQGPLQETLREWFNEVRGFKPVDPRVTDYSAASEIMALFLGSSYMVIGSREDMERAKESWVASRTEGSKRPFTANAQSAYQVLREMESQIKELVDRLSLVRAFPGVCEFCPLRTVRRRRRLRRGGRKLGVTSLKEAKIAGQSF